MRVDLEVEERRKVDVEELFVKLESVDFLDVFMIIVLKDMSMYFL